MQNSRVWPKANTPSVRLRSVRSLDFAKTTISFAQHPVDIAGFTGGEPHACQL